MTTIKPALGAAARAAIAARVEAILERAGARSDVAMVLADPVATSELCAFLAAPYRDEDGAAQVDAVVGAGEAGSVLAFETARQLRTAFDLGPSRWSMPAPGTRVLVIGTEIPDRALTGLAESVVRAGALLVECAVVVDRTTGRPRLAGRGGRVHPVRALVRLTPADGER